MEKTIIAIGTTSTQKLEYLNELIKDVGLNIELKPIEVESGVSSQPLSEVETRNGSINRAKMALDKTASAECGLGIEIGYNKNKTGRYEIFCYASIRDRKNNVVSGKSHFFPLPNFHH